MFSGHKQDGTGKKKYRKETARQLGVKVSNSINSALPITPGREACSVGQLLPTCAFSPYNLSHIISSNQSEPQKKIIFFFIDLVLNQHALHFRTCYWNPWFWLPVSPLGEPLDKTEVTGVGTTPGSCPQLGCYCHLMKCEAGSSLVAKSVPWVPGNSVWLWSGEQEAKSKATVSVTQPCLMAS